jgi:hypothetical protein
MFSSSDDDDDIRFDSNFDFDDDFDDDTDIVVTKKNKAKSTVNDDDDDEDIEDDDEDGPSDNVGQSSVEIDVESLIAELESEKVKGIDSDGDLRKRLDEILERKKHKHDLDDFDEYEID